MAFGRLSTASHCLHLVKSRDHEHFLTTLLLPARLQGVAFALRALNVEVSGVWDQVREPNIGLVRLQFWKDAVEALFDGDEAALPNHPVLKELSRHASRLDGDAVRRLVASKEAFSSAHPFRTVQDVERYSADSFSGVNLMLLPPEEEGGGSGSSVHWRHSASQLGVAEGFATLLRGIPFNASRRIVYLPAGLLAEHGASQEALLRGSTEPPVRRALESVASLADDHLRNCRFRKRFLSREERLAMLPAMLVDDYLSRLHKAGCDVFHPSLRRRNPLLPLRLYAKKWRRSF